MSPNYLLAELFCPQLFLPFRPALALGERWRHRTLRLGCFSTVIYVTLMTLAKMGAQF